MKACYMTDAGRVRSHNEDSVTILKNTSGEYLLIVADGMGGHRAGEVASSMVVTHFGKRFAKLSSVGSKSDAVNWLRDNIAEVNESILKYADENPNSKGLGTTAVIALLTDDYLIFANIGDSSGYVMKNGELHKVTHDHTLVNLLVQSGDITEEEAKYHPKKNVLMKALGAAEKVEPDIFDVDTEVEAILLCSDGLTTMLNNEQINHVLIDNELTIEQRVSKLIKKCNVRGGTDNISIAYLEMNDSDSLESGEEK
ncbi:MAG: Stp1/IreP family PP2C-type Ser/Thr phosphatase [Firmicutes bacterium]|nr:Stp1/IreP family PP2C-type Ser/Thr phosphatase [Bacillota bacterium]